MIESKEHDKLFADLEALNEQQIELGLAAGVWNEQVRPLVQHISTTLSSSEWKRRLRNLMKRAYAASRRSMQIFSPWLKVAKFSD